MGSQYDEAFQRQSQTLKCDVCKCYLSFPPIYVISADGEKQKCGRCKDIPTQINIRNKGFENLAKFFPFPCIYENCEEKLSWDKVETHERMCPHKTYQCNFLENCTDVVEITELERHYINKGHSKSHLFYDQLQRKNSKFNFNSVYLYITHNIPFIVYCCTVPQDFWFCVFSLMPNAGTNLRYEVKLSPENYRGSTLLFENQKIIPYDERKHCARCLFQYTCNIKFHKKNDNDFKITKISQEDIIKLSKSPSFTYTIKITGDFGTDSNSEMPLDRLHISSSSNALRQTLQCPICMEYMIGRIYTCNRGHVICNDCRAMVTICPTCKGDFGETRNFALEEMAENITFNCQFIQKGCHFVGNLHRLRGHEESCSFAN